MRGNHKITIGKRFYVNPNCVIYIGAHQTVGIAYNSTYPANTAAPSNGTSILYGAIIPGSALNHIIAIGKFCYSFANIVTYISAHQTIGIVDNSPYAGFAKPKGSRTGIRYGAIIPLIGLNHIIAISKNFHSTSNLITKRGAYQTVGTSDDPAYPGNTATPGNRTGISRGTIIPVRGLNQIIPSGKFANDACTKVPAY